MRTLRVAGSPYVALSVRLQPQQPVHPPVCLRVRVLVRLRLHKLNVLNQRVSPRLRDLNVLHQRVSARLHKLNVLNQRVGARLHELHVLHQSGSPRLSELNLQREGSMRLRVWAIQRPSCPPGQ